MSKLISIFLVNEISYFIGQQKRGGEVMLMQLRGIHCQRTMLYVNNFNTPFPNCISKSSTEKYKPSAQTHTHKKKKVMYILKKIPHNSFTAIADHGLW